MKPNLARVFRSFHAALGSLLLISSLSLPQGVGGADSLASLFGDPVIVRGKSVEVHRSQLDEAFIALRANLAARGEDIQDDQRAKKEISLLERIVLTQILSNIATDADKATADGLAKKFMDDAKKTAGDNDESFARQLRALGLSIKQFSDRVREQSLVETVIDRQLSTSVDVKDEDIKKFYTDNPEKFHQPESAKGLHIIVYTRDLRTGADLDPDQIKARKERLQRAQARAKAGEDFATLVKEYSEDPSLAEKKGEFQITRINKFPEIEGAAFSLPINAVSDVISTPNAFHLLKVTERTPEKQLELDKVRDDIKKFLSHREMEKRLPEFFAKLKKDANLEILDPKYQPVLETTSAEAFKSTLGK